MPSSYAVGEHFEQFIKLSQSLNYDTMIAAARGDDASRLSDTIAAPGAFSSRLTETSLPSACPAGLRGAVAIGTGGEFVAENFQPAGSVS